MSLQVKYYGANDFETDRYNTAIGKYQVRSSALYCEVMMLDVLRPVNREES